jgi:hypothetical protein
MYFGLKYYRVLTKKNKDRSELPSSTVLIFLHFVHNSNTLN